VGKGEGELRVYVSEADGYSVERDVFSFFFSRKFFFGGKNIIGIVNLRSGNENERLHEDAGETYYR
jgi:hypothetical protein